MLQNTKNHIHFIGIGGTGMSALARYYLAQNWAVSGSDLVKSSITQELAKEGVKVKIGHKKSHIIPKTDLIIRSQAVLSQNPELSAAKRLKLKILTYPEAVGEITRKYPTLAIAGAHGKSTTTAMAAKILLAAGKDPLVVLGAKYKALSGSNFRFGRGYFVLEADEYGAAFLNYAPAHAVINNIDREHLDFYGNFQNIKKAFLKFISRVHSGGILILNGEDKTLKQLKLKIGKIAKANFLRIVWYSLSGPEAEKIKKILKVPGRHNLLNALAAYNLTRLLGVPEKKIFSALKSYRGIWRRMEYKGKFEDRALVFDDYAHHPAEIQATLAGFREKYPHSPLLCVFEPHQAKRLKTLFKEFSLAFKNADAIIILPAYIVPGRDINEKKYNSKKLAEELGKKYTKKKIIYLADKTKLKERLRLILPSSGKKALIIMMGAGPIADLTPKILEKYKIKHENTRTLKQFISYMR